MAKNITEGTLLVGLVTGVILVSYFQVSFYELAEQSLKYIFAGTILAFILIIINKIFSRYDIPFFDLGKLLKKIK